jgi:septal ring factor EnvC (AmiA/AmiB activator)
MRVRAWCRTSTRWTTLPDVTHPQPRPLLRQPATSAITPNAQKAGVRRTTVADDQTLRKVTKLLARVERHIETTKDALQDLEIEFEVLKATVARLDPNVVSNDIENSSNTTGTGMRKF